MNNKLTETTGPLTKPEQTRRAELEKTIEAGMNHFLAVGEALAEIQRGRLYRDEYPTFEDYCKARWDFGSRRAFQMIDAADVVNETPGAMRTIVHTESQVRAVKHVPKALRVKVVKEAIRNANGKPVTAKLIELAAADVAPRRGGLAGQVLEARANQAKAATGARGKMLVALDEWWGENKAQLTGAVTATPGMMVRKFRDLIEQTLD